MIPPRIEWLPNQRPDCRRKKFAAGSESCCGASCVGNLSAVSPVLICTETRLQLWHDALRNATASATVFRVVFLMIFLRKIERARERNFSSNGSGKLAAVFQLRRGSSRNRFLFRRGEENGRAILTAAVRAVALLRARVVHRPKGLEQCAKGDLRGIVFHFDHL